MFAVAFRILILLITSSIQASAACECERCSCECNVFDRLVEMQVDMLEMKREMKTLQEADLKQKEDMKELQTGVRQELMAVNKSLEPVKTPLVAFSAYNPTDETSVVGKVIVFQSVFLNAGDGYDTKTGVFTAPVTGLYHFSAHICQTDSKYMIFAIYLDEIRLAVSSIYVETYSICGSVSVVTIAEEGQRITVRYAYSDCKLFQNSYRNPSFIGFLVHS